jgi:excisionase family DNA binding protein
MLDLIASKRSAAAALNCSEKHIDRLIDAGELVAVREGRRIKILTESIYAYLNRLPRLSTKQKAA